MGGTRVDKGERGELCCFIQESRLGYHPIILPLLRLVEPQFTWHICTEKGPLCEGVILRKQLILRPKGLNMLELQSVVQQSIGKPQQRYSKSAILKGLSHAFEH